MTSSRGSLGQKVLMTGPLARPKTTQTDNWSRQAQRPAVGRGADTPHHRPGPVGRPRTKGFGRSGRSCLPSSAGRDIGWMILVALQPLQPVIHSLPDVLQLLHQAGSRCTIPTTFRQATLMNPVIQSIFGMVRPIVRISGTGYRPDEGNNGADTVGALSRSRFSPARNGRCQVSFELILGHSVNAIRCCGQCW